MAASVKPRPYKKQVIRGRVQNWDHRVFSVQGVGTTEQEIFIQFGDQVDFQVVKLSRKGLPPRDPKGNKIHWINNFAIRDAAGHPVDKVQYTVFVREPSVSRKTFVYFDQKGLNTTKRPRRKGSKPEQPGFLQIDFTSGDPGVGWT